MTSTPKWHWFSLKCQYSCKIMTHYTGEWWNTLLFLWKNEPTDNNETNRLSTSWSIWNTVYSMAVMWYISCIVWLMWHLNQSQLSMVVADGLVPIWHQDISNHHDVVGQSQSVDIRRDIWWPGAFLAPWHMQPSCSVRPVSSYQGDTWWPVAYLAPGHLQPSWWLRPVSSNQARHLMAWWIFGTRTSAFPMMS